MSALFALAILGVPLPQRAVDQPDKCELANQTQLTEARRTAYSSSPVYVQYVFDPRLGGDRKLARLFFEQHGYFEAAGRPGDPYSVFLPDIEGGTNRGRGDPALGVKLACQASWISGMPFVSIHIMNEDGLITSVEVK